MNKKQSSPVEGRAAAVLLHSFGSTDHSSLEVTGAVCLPTGHHVLTHHTFPSDASPSLPTEAHYHLTATDCPPRVKDLRVNKQEPSLCITRRKAAATTLPCPSELAWCESLSMIMSCGCLQQPLSWRPQRSSGYRWVIMEKAAHGGTR